MLASLLLDLWYRALVGVGVAYGLLLAGMAVFGLVVLRPEAKRLGPLADVHATWGGESPVRLVASHRAVPRQRPAVTR